MVVVVVAVDATKRGSDNTLLTAGFLTSFFVGSSELTLRAFTSFG